MTDVLALNRLIRSIVGEETQRLERSVGVGVVDVVEGDKAALTIPPASMPTSGFTVPPHLSPQRGDLAVFHRQGSFTIITDILNRNALVSPDPFPVRGELPLAEHQRLRLTTPGELAWVADTVASGNDYAEGSFTPTISFGGASAGVTYNTTNTSGRYIKIAKSVFVSLRLQLTSKGTSVGAALIGGLPFAPTLQSVGNFVPIGGMAGLTGAMAGYASGLTVVIRQTTATGTSVLTDAHFTNTSDVFFSSVYSSGV